MKDMIGNDLKPGDKIVYCTNSRYPSLTLGVVMESNKDSIKVLGEGNARVGELAHEFRILRLEE